MDYVQQIQDLKNKFVELVTAIEKDKTSNVKDHLVSIFRLRKALKELEVRIDNYYRGVLLVGEIRTKDLFCLIKEYLGNNVVSFAGTKFEEFPDHVGITIAENIDPNTFPNMLEKGMVKLLDLEGVPGINCFKLAKIIASDDVLIYSSDTTQGIKYFSFTVSIEKLLELKYGKKYICYNYKDTSYNNVRIEIYIE